MKHLLASALLALFFVGSLFAQDLFSDSQNRFTIQPPSGWTVKPGSSPTTVFLAVFRDAEDRHAIIMITKVPVTSFTLPPVSEFSSTYAKKPYIASMVLSKEGDSTLAGLPAIWFSATVAYKPGFSRIEKQYAIIHDGSLYLFGLITDNDPAYFAEMEPLMLRSIQSFKFQ